MRTSTSNAAPLAWAPLIEDYLVTLAAAGQPPTTLKLRRTQLVRMTRDLDGRPTDLTAEALVARFGSQRQWSIETRRSYRAGARIPRLGVPRRPNTRLPRRRAPEGATTQTVTAACTRSCLAARA